MAGKYNISVIIPNYNRSEQLVRAVKSVLSQTLPAFEVLICDDGSTDDSRERIIALGDDRVRWISCGRNGRPAIPRNIGIKESTGNFVSFLDNDDEWVNTKLERQVELLEMTGLNVVCSNASKITEGENKGPYSALRFSQVLNFYNLVASNSVICSSVLVKKEIVEKYGAFPEEPELKALEDYFLWLKISTGNDIYYTPELLVNYSDESATSIRKDSMSTQQQLDVIFRTFKKWAHLNADLCPPYLTAVMKELFVLRFMTPRQKFFSELFDR